MPEIFLEFEILPTVWGFEVVVTIGGSYKSEHSPPHPPPNGNPGLEESMEKLAATRSACMEEVEGGEGGGQVTDKQKMREKEREQSIY